jgi:hypothetical protein
VRLEKLTFTVCRRIRRACVKNPDHDATREQRTTSAGVKETAEELQRVHRRLRNKFHKRMLEKEMRSLLSRWHRKLRGDEPTVDLALDEEDSRL